MNDEKYFNNNLLEIIGIIVFMIIYSLLGIYIFPLNLILFSLPFIYLGVRRGIVQSTLSQLMVAIIIAVVVDIYSGAMLVLLFLPISYTIIEGIKSRRKPVEILGLSTAILFVSLLLIYGFIQNSGINIINQMEEGYKLLLSTQVDMLKEMGLTNFEILKATDLLKSGYRYILWILPVILFLVSILVCYSNYYFSVIALRKAGLGIVNIPRFSKFKLPNNIMQGIIVMFIGVFIMKSLQLPYYETVFLNVVALIWFMFIIQGLSVVDFLLIKLKWRLSLRVFLIIVMAAFAPLGTMISIIGISDVIFDLRKYRKRKA